MTRTIDADALLKDIGDEPEAWTGSPEEIAERNEYRRIRTIIESQPTIDSESKWISVKDRLPESGKRCLVYATQGIERHISIASFGRQFHLSGRRAYWRVTHWMPLPEPPKEVSADV